MRFLKKLYNLVVVKLLSQEGYIRHLRKQGVKIGKNCSVSKDVVFGTEPFLISIGDNTRISLGVKFITHDGGLLVLRNLGLVQKEAVKFGRIKIGSNCNIGWNAIIMPNVIIGDNTIIAAGAVVTKNVPANTIWGGYLLSK